MSKTPISMESAVRWNGLRNDLFTAHGDRRVAHSDHALGRVKMVTTLRMEIRFDSAAA